MSVVSMEVPQAGDSSESSFVDKTTTASSGAKTCSWDFSDVLDYQSLTVDNFSLVNVDLYLAATTSGNIVLNKKYNSSTGVFSVSLASPANALSFKSGVQYKARCSI